MERRVFINLPVTDLDRSIAFYAALDGARDPRFSDESAVMMRLSDTIYVMLLTHARFATFSPRPIADTQAAAVLLCLTVDSRAAVDAMVDAVTAAAGSPDPTPADDHGFMYGRSIADPDGHLWQVMWMDMDAAVAALG